MTASKLSYIAIIHKAMLVSSGKRGSNRVSIKTPGPPVHIVAHCRFSEISSIPEHAELKLWYLLTGIFSPSCSPRSVIWRGRTESSNTITLWWRKIWQIYAKNGWTQKRRYEGFCHVHENFAFIKCGMVGFEVMTFVPYLLKEKNSWQYRTRLTCYLSHTYRDIAHIGNLQPIYTKITMLDRKIIILHTKSVENWVLVPKFWATISLLGKGNPSHHPEAPLAWLCLVTWRVTSPMEIFLGSVIYIWSTFYFLKSFWGHSVHLSQNGL